MSDTEFTTPRRAAVMTDSKLLDSDDRGQNFASDIPSLLRVFQITRYVESQCLRQRITVP